MILGYNLCIIAYCGSCCKMFVLNKFIVKYKIRKANKKDAKNIAKVHIQSWRESYNGIVDDQYLKKLSLVTRTKKWQVKLQTSEKNVDIFVAEDTSYEIVGFITGGISRDKLLKYKGELYAIYILKQAQKNKLGYRLVKKLCVALKKQGIKSMFVRVLKDNTSKNFYIKYRAKLFKTTKLKIGERKLVEEYYGWPNFKKFGI
mgnify:CR=1 FL=1